MKKTLLLLPALAALTLATASAQDVWTTGHGDIGIGYDAGELDPHWHIGEGNETVTINGTAQNFGAGGTEYAPDGLIARTSLSLSRPADSAWDSIGVSANATYYVFPELEDPNTPFVGFGAEELDPLDWDGNLTLTLTSMTGPATGVFSLYQEDVTLTFFMTTNDGISPADSISIAPGGHTHYSFAFTQLGTYALTFEVSGTHMGDGSKSASATYTFNVVPEPGTATLAILGLAALAATRARRRR